MSPERETTMAIEESNYYRVLVSLKCREAGFPQGHIFDLTAVRLKVEQNQLVRISD
jgi:hypothetical protein